MRPVSHKCVFGAVLVIFLCSWRTICTILQPMGSNRRLAEEITETLLTKKEARKPGISTRREHY
jgi:hypothetical protein